MTLDGEALKALVQRMRNDAARWRPSYAGCDVVDASKVDEWAYELDALLQQPASSIDPRVLDATIRAFEALQGMGLYLHNTSGHVLGRDGFIEAMAVALKAATNEGG